MSNQTLSLKVKGLFTSFNEFSEAPEGSLQVADNIDILQDSMPQPRRGFDKDSAEYSDVSDRTDAIYEYQDKIISHHGTYGSADTLSYNNSGTWTSIETVSAISSRRMKFIGANQNLYYTSSTGIRALDAYNGTPRAAGAFKALDITASTSATAASIFSSTGDQVAYRAVWLYIDANKNYHFSSPSQREILTCTDTAKGIDLAVTIPSGVTTSWFLQIYRSSVFASGSTPNDELALVYEVNPSSGDISAKSISFTDITPDSLRGATIYTASSQEGIASANEVPPLAEDMAFYDNCIFYFNTTSKHRYYLTVISTGGSSGVTTNDTITIGGITYTAKTSETAASAQFKAYTSATDAGNTVAQNIDLTAKSLVRVINQYASSTVYAYYISGYSDLPGKILIEERSVGGNSFAVTSSRATCWSPSNIPTSGTTSSSTNDRRVNGCAYSKPNQPEAVPLTQYLDVGSRNDEGLRVKALRDGVYFFKKSGEMYKLTGSFPNYQVTKIEDSLKLISRESLTVLNNEIYGLFDQGIAVVSDSTKIISRPIEQDLLSLVNQNYSLVQSISFGVSYDSDRKYYIFLPSGGGDTYPTQAYVFNTFTTAWTRHILNASCAFVDSSNNFYYGNAAANFLMKEKKNYSFLDAADYSFTSTISTISGTTITVGSGFDNLHVGDLLYQSSSVFAQISALDPATQQITIVSDPGLSVAAVTILTGIAAELKWIPLTMGNPSLLKQVHTLSLLFKKKFVGEATLTFKSDLSPAEEDVTVEGSGLSLWGLFSWGEDAWGGDTYKGPVRQLVPRDKQRCSQLTVGFRHNWGFSDWLLEGAALFGNFNKEKVNR